jgi:hypothetical protein
MIQNTVSSVFRKYDKMIKEFKIGERTLRSIPFLILFSLGIFVLSCAKAGTYSVSLRYQPLKEFPSLQAKMGPSLGMAPFEDERPDALYIGVHTHLQGDSSYFKSNPFPLERVFKESLADVLSRYAVKTIPISHWDGKPESLENMETDSVMMIKIKRFWTEGKASAFRTTIKTTVQFVIHLGVKKGGKVFTRNVEVDKEMTVARSTPKRVEAMINQILADVFDSYFSNPY